MRSQRSVACRFCRVINLTFFRSLLFPLGRVPSPYSQSHASVGSGAYWPFRALLGSVFVPLSAFLSARVCHLLHVVLPGHVVSSLINAREEHNSQKGGLACWPTPVRPFSLFDIGDICSHIVMNVVQFLETRGTDSKRILSNIH